MDYEKKYKEAQKWIESIYSELSHEHQMEAEAFFPELKESEDERIRKTLIRFFKDNYPNETEMYDGTVTVGKALAWLEKQGEKDKIESLRTEYGKGKADVIAEMEKLAWSEADSDFMYDTLSNLTEIKNGYGEGYGNVGKCIDWLKSLKQRIGG